MMDSNAHILIAEDDDDDYYIFTLAIAETSVKVMVTRAENGKLLLELLEREVPDIVFLDLLMPQCNGQECLKVIRGNKKYDALPIIVYTSLRDLENIEYCYREGSNLFVVKPDSFTDLKNILQRILTIDWKKTMYYPSRADYVLKAS